MNKLELAHDYAKVLLQQPVTRTIGEVVSISFGLAEEMLAENEKREDKSRPEVLEEWQPDWSQAPEGFNRFVVGSAGGHGFFTNIEPQMQGDFWFVGADGVVVDGHGYKGHWKDSLRKRP